MITATLLSYSNRLYDSPVAAPVLQLRVPEDTLARVDAVRGNDTRSAWLLRLIDRALTSTAQPASQAPPSRSPARASRPPAPSA